MLLLDAFKNYALQNNITTKYLLRNFSNIFPIKLLEMINIFFIIIKKERLRAIASEDEERDKDKIEEKFSTIFPSFLKSQMEHVFRGTWRWLLCWRLTFWQKCIYHILGSLMTNANYLKNCQRSWNTRCSRFQKTRARFIRECISSRKWVGIW